MYGVGGIGGFLGSYLTKLDIDITFIARGDRFGHLLSKGLILKSKLGNKIANKLDVREDIERGERFDIIIITVKLYDFDDVIKNIKEKIVGDFVILPFQNGIYSEELIKREIGVEKVCGAVAQISAFINNDQNIEHVGKLATFFVGPYEGLKNNFLKSFCETSQSVGLDLRFTNNIKEKIWQKFIFLSAYSGITTLTENSIGQIFSNKRSEQKFIGAMEETYKLSKLYGVKFKRNPVSFWLEKIAKMPFEMTSSMFMDFKKQKQLELEWLSGFIISHSSKKGFKPRYHQEIVAGIKAKLTSLN